MTLILKFKSFIGGCIMAAASLQMAAQEIPQSSSITLEFSSQEAASALIESRPDIKFERIIPQHINPEIEARHRAAGLDLLFTVEPVKSKNLDTEMEKLKVCKGVVRVERSKMINLRLPDTTTVPSNSVDYSCPALSEYAESPNDPGLSRQWHYDLINMSKAWTITTGSPDVVVAVLDCPIDTEHPDLRQNIWVNEAELYGEPGIDDDGNGYVDDIHGYNFYSPGDTTPGNHGTHIAGTIAASNNNGIGGCGIAGGYSDNPGVKVMTLGINDPIISFGFAEDWKIARAFVYAADNGAVIVSNSWGGGDKLTTGTLTTAMNYYMKYAGQFEGSPLNGGLIVFAAGNDNSSVRTNPFNDPDLNFDNFIVVGSVGAQGVKSSFSNYGEWIDIMAPGGEFTGESIYSTAPNGQYMLMNGTSMACPHVAAVAALVVSKYGKGSLTPNEVKQRLLNSTTDVYRYNIGRGYDGRLGRGLLDAYRAVAEEPEASPSPVTDLMAEHIGDYVTISFSIPADGNGDAVDKCILYTTTPKVPILEFKTGGLAPGSVFEQSFTEDYFPTEGKVYMAASDMWGKLSEPSQNVALLPCDDEYGIFNLNVGSKFYAFKPCYEGYDSYKPVSPLKVKIHTKTPGSFVDKYTISVSDPNGIVTHEAAPNNAQIVTISPTADTPVGTYTFTMRIQDDSDPAKFAEENFEYEVIEGLRKISGPILKPGISDRMVMPAMEGHFELNLREILYDPFGMDFIIPDKVDFSFFLHNCDGYISEDTLYCDYEFDEASIDFGNNEIEVTFYPYNDYMAPSTVNIYLKAPDVSGIEDIAANEDYYRKGIFTMTGINVNLPIDQLAPGLYIINGKKTVIGKQKMQ